MTENTVPTIATNSPAWACISHLCEANVQTAQQARTLAWALLEAAAELDVV